MRDLLIRKLAAIQQSVAQVGLLLFGYYRSGQTFIMWVMIARSNYYYLGYYRPGLSFIIWVIIAQVRCVIIWVIRANVCG